MSATLTPAPSERPRGRDPNLIYKSGPLYISAKGFGWKSWKRRWFILTRTSFVFFKNDPNGDDHLTLGGIDLNSSGTVISKAEKKLLSVLFADGRVVTVKAENMDDLDEWKAALERALLEAPNALLQPWRIGEP